MSQIAMPDTCFLLIIVEDGLPVGQLYLPGDVAADTVLIRDRCIRWAESMCGGIESCIMAESHLANVNLHEINFQEAGRPVRQAFASVYTATRH